MLHEYHVIYSVRYYPQFHVTAVGLGTYYPWIRGHYCIRSPFITLTPTSYGVQSCRMSRCKQAARAHRCRKITIGLHFAYKSISETLWILMFRLPKFFRQWEIFTRTRGKRHNVSNFIYLFIYFVSSALNPACLSFLYQSFFPYYDFRYIKTVK
jgi:hypothetical protein